MGRGWMVKKRLVRVWTFSNSEQNLGKGGKVGAA